MIRLLERVRACAGAAARRRAAAGFVAALAVLAAAPAGAQESVAGTWWFELGGEDAGALLLGVGEPHNGAVAIEDTETEQTSFGYAQAVGAFFRVASGQLLTIDSRGTPVGALALTDPDTGASVGTLGLERSKLSKRLTRWKLRGALTPDGASEVRVTLRGERLPPTFPVLTGGGPETRLSGKRVSSRAFDLHVVRDSSFDLPAYAFAGAGSARIDGAEQSGVTLSGAFMLSPRERLFGRLEESSPFGAGEVTGTLALVKGKLVPRLHLVARGDRRVVADARLLEPAEPILRVAPRSLDFGASHLNEPHDAALAVTNAGTGVLSGGVRFLDGASDDFQIVSGASYVDLEPGDPAHSVTVRFLPTTAGGKSEQILLDIDGGRVGAQIVTVRGVGGLATLTVDPAGPIEFPDTAVGGQAVEELTVRNTGDGPLSGSATLTGSAELELAESSSGPALASLDYELAPDEATTFVVRFRPTTTGTKSGALQLTGGGGASVGLSGSTP